MRPCAHACTRALRMRWPQAEGMVHLSNITKRPIQNASEVVKRGAEVWVKVLSLGRPNPSTGQLRPMLSMRDVDQDTGAAHGMLLQRPVLLAWRAHTQAPCIYRGRWGGAVVLCRNIHPRGSANALNAATAWLAGWLQARTCCPRTCSRATAAPTRSRA